MSLMISRQTNRSSTTSSRGFFPENIAIQAPKRAMLAPHFWIRFSFTPRSMSAYWLQGDIQPPEIDFRSSPNTGHSEAHAGLPLVTHNGHRAS